MTRVPPLPPRQWPPEMREALAALVPADPVHPLPPRDDPTRPKGLNILGLLARHPTLTRAYNTFNGHVLFTTTLTPRQRELLVLRVATVRGATYEWLQHVVVAGDAGLSPIEIARVADDPGADEWSPLERSLLAAADELIADARITEATYSVLTAELDHRQLMDVVFTVGAYDILAMAMRTFDIEIDDDLRKWASP